MVARSRTGLVALVMAAGLGLTGCTGSGEPRSSVALEVGDQTVSVEELQGEVETLRQANPNSDQGRNDGASVQQSLISQKIMDELHGELASRAGLEIDEDRVNQVKDQFRKQLKDSDESLPDSVIDESARRQVLQSQIPQALLGKNYQQRMQNNPDLDLNKLYQRRMQKLASEIPIEVNPRFGSFDKDTNFAQALQGQPIIDAQGGQLAKLTEPDSPQQPPLGQ